tara:strand:+ start:993 stop:1727 length:735 start_codon:yes stop_codon:yes gene_type:complete
MTESKHFQFSNAVVVVPLVLVLLIWTVYMIEIRLGVNFNSYGILPRTLKGLRGVVLSPIIHGSLKHLFNNTVPLAVLSAALLYFYRRNAFTVLIFGTLLSGMLTWMIGRESYHIGASGLIYVLASFIFFKGIFSKYYRMVALSLVVVFIYGSMLWYIFPVKEEISWEGHLSGFLVGLFFAFFLKTPIPVINKYDWEREDYNEEEDEFLQHFDENGNFIEKKPEQEIENLEFKINYEYKEDKSSD